MSYVGFFCKYGIEKDKAKAVIEELIPEFSVSEIIEYAYSNNTFGCERKLYIRMNND